MKDNFKVLWIEDNADNDLYHLTSPVYIEGRYQLDIATSASEADYYLNQRVYDVVIVDVRIPPGKNPGWKKKYEALRKTRNVNSSRLGLELLKSIFGRREGIRNNLKIEENQAPDRYGVFTVERYEELEPDLKKLRLEELKYKRKNATMPHTALLDFIDEISRGRDN